MQLLSQAEGILNQEAPIIPVYYYVHAYLIRPWVKGIPTDPQRMIPLQHMRVERQ
jgi:ABC-type oligopeptide transport system substrate-binding subunit